jgi:hypothetical protein
MAGLPGAGRGRCSGVRDAVAPPVGAENPLVAAGGSLQHQGPGAGRPPSHAATLDVAGPDPPPAAVRHASRPGVPATPGLALLESHATLPRTARGDARLIVVPGSRVAHGQRPLILVEALRVRLAIGHARAKGARRRPRAEQLPAVADTPADGGLRRRFASFPARQERPRQRHGHPAQRLPPAHPWSQGFRQFIERLVPGGLVSFPIEIQVASTRSPCAPNSIVNFPVLALASIAGG